MQGMRTTVLVLVLLAGAAVARAEDANALGKRIYVERCSACHGDDGRGDGPAAMALEPKPRNFVDAAFWKGRTQAQVRAVVEHGKPGTMMAPFSGVLSDAEIDAVVDYVRHFAPPSS